MIKTRSMNLMVRANATLFVISLISLIQPTHSFGRAGTPNLPSLNEEDIMKPANRFCQAGADLAEFKNGVQDGISGHKYPALQEQFTDQVVKEKWKVQPCAHLGQTTNPFIDKERAPITFGNYQRIKKYLTENEKHFPDKISTSSSQNKQVDFDLLAIVKRVAENKQINEKEKQYYCCMRGFEAGLDVLKKTMDKHAPAITSAEGTGCAMGIDLGRRVVSTLFQEQGGMCLDKPAFPFGCFALGFEAGMATRTPDAVEKMIAEYTVPSKMQMASEARIKPSLELSANQEPTAGQAPAATSAK